MLLRHLRNIGSERVTTTCIYCDEPGPFSDEHVFPAGLGGDDGRYLLKGLVCRSCNSGVFSKQEVVVARRGPEAIARLFLQPEGRGSGKKASIPSLQAGVTTLIDPKTQLVYEATLLAGGTPVVLPQVLFVGNQLTLTGSAAEGINALLHSLNATLQDELCLIRKDANAAKANYLVQHYRWRNDDYALERSESLEIPPKLGIWREDLRVPESPVPGARYFVRLFRRPEGQLVLRVSPDIDVDLHISVLRQDLPKLKVPDDLPVKSIERPSMHLGMSVDVTALPRVLAKIGVNFLCHEFGDRYVRHPAFDEVKRAILTGNTAVHYRVAPADDPVQQLFARVAPTLHIVMITGYAGRGGQMSIVAFMRLYGGPIHFVKLAEGRLGREFPLFFTVDYEKHQIQRYDIMEWSRTYPPVQTVAT